MNTYEEILSDAADQIGDIDAQIAELKIKREVASDLIINSGEEEVSGQYFRARRVDRAGSKKVNWQKIAKDLKASAQRIAANTSIGRGSTYIKITGRNAEAA